MRVLDLVRQVDRQRFRLDFVTLSGLPGALDAEFEKFGCTIYPTKLGWRFPMAFWQLLRTGRYDVLHSHVHFFSGFVLLIGAMMGVPVRVAHFRSTYDGKGNSFLRRLKRWILSWMIDRAATNILAVSQGALEANWPNWRDDARCKVIYNGIDVSRYPTTSNRDEVRAELDIPTEACCCMHVGRFDEEKNHERLIHIFADVCRRQPGAQLVLVGRGGNSVEERVRATVDQLGLESRVVFVGERPDVPRLLQGADVLIHPSLWEGLPGVVLEACATGLPVVASSLPGVMEISSKLPRVYALPLAVDDQGWGELIVSVLNSSRGKAPSVTEALEQFSKSDFALGRCVEAHCQVWQGGHYANSTES